MARIRTIKPELPQSETVGRLSREARLLFVLLFTVADDAGRVRAASRLLASLLYPYDDDAPGLIDGWLDELVDQKQVRLYEVDGSRYLEIVKWLEHQKIDRPSASKLPAPPEASPDTREGSRALGVVSVPSTVPVPRSGSNSRATDRDEVSDKPTKIGADFQPSAHSVEYAKSLGMADAVFNRELSKFIAFNMSAHRAAVDHQATFRLWCERWREREDKEGRPLQVVSDASAIATVLIVEGTPEEACWQQFTRETTGRPMFICKQINAEGREVRGARRPSAFPPGYDEATGEKLAPKGDEAAA